MSEQTQQPEEAAGIGGTDPALGDDYSLTSSLASSVLDYQYENGRRYHKVKQGTYWGPNDEEAADEMDLNQHIMMIATGGRLHLAPIASPQRVLDLGTGTGLWAIQMGDEYPDAHILGNDLSPIQPSLIPPNVQFEVDDFCDEWTYRASSFDLIHASQILGCVDDYPRFYSQVLKALKPGGWYEHADIDVRIYSDDGSHLGTPFEKFGLYNLQVGHSSDRDIDIAPKMKSHMEKAGFTGVTEVVYKWPIGSWPTDEKEKKIGQYHALAWNIGVEAWILRLFTQVLKWKAEDVKTYCAQLCNTIKDKDVHAYQKLYVCYGQKPE